MFQAGFRFIKDISNYNYVEVKFVWQISRPSSTIPSPMCVPPVPPVFLHMRITIFSPASTWNSTKGVCVCLSVCVYKERKKVNLFLFLNYYILFLKLRHLICLRVTELQSDRHPRVPSIPVGEVFLCLISIISPTSFACRGIMLVNLAYIISTDQF